MSDVALMPIGSRPQTSPTSRPALSAPCTQAPASSSSGCERIPCTAARPTLPVAHWITRYAIATSGFLLSASRRTCKEEGRDR